MNQSPVFDGAPAGAEIRQERHPRAPSAESAVAKFRDAAMRPLTSGEDVRPQDRLLEMERIGQYRDAYCLPDENGVRTPRRDLHNAFAAVAEAGGSEAAAAFYAARGTFGEKCGDPARECALVAKGIVQLCQVGKRIWPKDLPSALRGVAAAAEHAKNAASVARLCLAAARMKPEDCERRLGILIIHAPLCGTRFGEEMAAGMETNRNLGCVARADGATEFRLVNGETWERSRLDEMKQPSENGRKAANAETEARARRTAVREAARKALNAAPGTQYRAFEEA